MSQIDNFVYIYNIDTIKNKKNIFTTFFFEKLIFLLLGFIFG